VRSSWEASATNARWRSSVVSVSLRASLSEASIPLSVRDSSATSSSAIGAGRVRFGSRVRSISPAGRRQLGDRRDRAPCDQRTGGEGKRGPNENPERQQQFEVADLHREWWTGSPYWTMMLSVSPTPKLTSTLATR